VPLTAGGPSSLGLRAAAKHFAEAVDLPWWVRGVPGYTSRTRSGRTAPTATRRNTRSEADGDVDADADDDVDDDAEDANDDDDVAMRLASAFVRLRRDYPQLQGYITGHVHDLRALLAAEAAAEVAGLPCLAPCWGQPRASELLLKCRGGASAMLVTRWRGGCGGAAVGRGVGSVVRSAEEVRALVDEVGGFEAADGDSRGAALDMIPSEAAFYVPGAVIALLSASDAARGGDGGGGGGDDSGVVECEDGTSEVDWSCVHTRLVDRKTAGP